MSAGIDWKLAPGVPDLAALGAARPEDLLGTGAALEGEEHAEVVARERSREVLRYPLPGTPGPDGNFRGRPRGAGTGWVRVHRYTGFDGFRAAFRARFTEPRSASPAAREWNLLCHLRAYGVGTPEPLALGSDGPRSFLVVRELDGMLPLPAWIARCSDADVRRRAGLALGHFLQRLHRARAVLPDFAAQAVHLSADDLERGEDDDSCAAVEIDRLAAESRARRSSAARLVFRRLPDVALGGVGGGRLASAPRPAELERWLRLLDEGTAGAPRVTPRERRRVAKRARDAG